MPRMGQSMEEGAVLRWLKDIGDEVQRGEVIAEIETDKAVVEMESFVSGTLTEIVVPAGETVAVGTTIAIVEDEQPEPAAESEQGEPATQPARSERIIATPVARRLAKEHGIDLAEVEGTGPDGRIGKEDVERQIAQSKAEPATRASRRVKATPAARRLAEEHDVDLSQIEGTGPQGSVSKADVEAWLAAQEPTQAGERVPLSKIKRTTARRMVVSKTTVPHFYVSTDIKMTRALALRDSLRARAHEVSVNDLILRAATLALAEFPNLNATYVDDELQRHEHVNLAMAVALDDGLITPVVHACETLSLTELAAAANDVIERARGGRLRPADLDGGTFTVSNLGMFDVKHFEAIVNPPQAAILAVGRVRRVPAFDARDRVVPAHLLTATVSADHRVTDGAEVARFLQALKRILEDGFELVGG